MIRAEEKSAKDTDFALRKAQLQYQQDQLTARDGSVTASITGTVTEVKDVAALAEGETVIVVKGDENFIVTAYVNEMNLEKIKEGDKLNITSYESGLFATATVREILPMPASSMYGYGMDNPNSSYYPVEAVIDDPTLEFTVGESCEARPVTQEEDADTFYIPLMYVRNDAGGNYVMMADNGKLKKQYVKTGKILYGYEIEIKSGLTAEDSIAFPYGKKVNEGALAVVSEELMWY